MMSLHKNLFWNFFLILYMICSTNHVESSCNSEPSPVAKVINHLSFRITNELGGNDNLFFSPLSVSLAMGMVYLGASGNTAEEIRSSLGYDLLGNTTDEEVHLHFHSFLIDMDNGGDEYQLLIANSLFTQVGYDVLQKYANNLGLYYHAQQDSLDFASNGEEAINTMNNWVSNKTKRKIPQLFQTPLDTTTILVLLNAVYFKGTWKYPFDSEASHYRNFYGYNGPKRIMFMRQTKRLNYYYDEESDHDFLELLYKGNHISMVFALPRSENISIIDFNAETLCRIRNGFQRTSVEVYIPRFKLNYEKELSDIMKRFGINSAFDYETASFTGIRNENDIKISLIQHKAVIEVNEQGSEAAASTGVVFEARSGFSIRTRFIADHPFLFFILDRRSGSILFEGRLSDPEDSE